MFLSEVIPEISPDTLKEWLDEGRAVTVLDVRQDDEVLICRIEGSVHIPLADLPDLFCNIDAQFPIVTVCHHGVRSMKAAVLLKEKGFDEVLSLQGGIDAWAKKIDPTMNQY